jgi:hypothetical protein
MFELLFIKYPLKYTIISCSVTVVVAVVGFFFCYFFCIKKKVMVKEKSDVDVVEDVVKTEGGDTLCYLDEVREGSVRTKSIKTLKMEDCKSVESKYLKNFNQDNPVYIDYLHKSNRPFVGYDTRPKKSNKIGLKT